VLAVAFDDGSIRLYSTGNASYLESIERAAQFINYFFLTRMTIAEHKYELLATLSDGHRRPVRRFAWHRSGQSVLTTSTDSVCLWETRTNFDTSAAAAVAAGAHSKGKSSSAKNGGWKKIRTLSIAAAQQTAAALVSQVTQVLSYSLFHENSAREYNNIAIQMHVSL
jgi:WD40 repeat protein